jgi:hypothetical protein
MVIALLITSVVNAEFNIECVDSLLLKQWEGIYETAEIESDLFKLSKSKLINKDIDFDKIHKLRDNILQMASELHEFTPNMCKEKRVAFFKRMHTGQPGITKKDFLQFSCAKYLSALETLHYNAVKLCLTATVK